MRMEGPTEAELQRYTKARKRWVTEWSTCIWCGKPCEHEAFHNPELKLFCSGYCRGVASDETN